MASTSGSSPVNTTLVCRRIATSPAIDGPAMAEIDTWPRSSAGTWAISARGRMVRLPSSSACMPFASAITCMPGRNNAASCSPAQSTPNEFTPLITSSTPSKASAASSSWYAVTLADTARFRFGCTPVDLIESMIARSRWVPTSLTSCPLSVNGVASAVAMIPEPSTTSVVIEVSLPRMLPT